MRYFFGYLFWQKYAFVYIPYRLKKDFEKWKFKENAEKFYNF